jgi:hypothetical protein
MTSEGNFGVFAAVVVRAPVVLQEKNSNTEQLTNQKSCPVI